jgi:hypothetical protein
MTDKILSTGEALHQAQGMVAKINGFTSSITDLNRTGQQLSDPAHWDGPYAVQFRTVWSESWSKLQQAEAALKELQSKVQNVITAINRAGGLGG